MLSRWSVGQRLVAGFGLVLAVQVAVLAAVLGWLWQNDAAQEQYVGEVLPHLQLAGELERALLHTSVAWRTYLLVPADPQARAYEASAERAREALRRLGQHRLRREAPERLERLQALVERYLAETGQAMRSRAPGSIEPLTGARDDLLREIGELADLEQRAGAEALAAMRENRGSARRTLALTSILASLVLLGVGFLVVQSIRRPARRLMHVARSMQQGHWRDALELSAIAPSPASGRNEMAQIAGAFGAAAAALQQRERRLGADGAVAWTVASSADPEELARATLRVVMEYVEASAGVVYRADGELVPLAHAGLAAAPRRLPMTGGLAGEAALSRCAVARAVPPGDPVLDADAAPHAAAIPLQSAGTLLGVMLLGSTRPLDGLALAFMEASGATIALGFRTLLAHEETRRLLAQVQENAAVIAAQNRELHARNQEIQAQSEEIQAQSEELQAQSEEIQVQNEEIQVQNEELQQHAAELHEQALLLREADRHKNEFIGLLAHEVRNPLAAISNSTSLLGQLPAGSDAFARCREVIERQVRHLSRLVDDLLDITRISRGKVRLRREPLEINALVEECAADQRAALEKGGVALELRLPPEPAWVYGDHTRLCQVVGNLLSNAAKFTPSGGRIVLSVEAPAAATTVAIRVADNGAGIDAQLMSRLFEPFSQGPDEHARAGGGLGLGLALVRGLVELHGGVVSAHSDGPGRGSEFVVRLSRVPAPTAAPAAAPAAPPPASGRRAARRVLLVEDNPDGAQSMRDLLEAHGYQVRVAASGPEALDKAAEEAPDIVLCDVGLPGMDGYAVARALRAQPSLADVTLIAVTGFATESDRQRAWEAGFDEHVAKPADPARLLAILARRDARMEG